MQQDQNICFRYGQNTYNPVTKTAGRRWECRLSFFHRLTAKEACTGDPFELASGKIPYRLTKNAYKTPKIMDMCVGKN